MSQSSRREDALQKWVESKSMCVVGLDHLGWTWGGRRRTKRKDVRRNSGETGTCFPRLPQSPTPLVAPRCSVGQRPQLEPLRMQQNDPSAGSHRANSANWRGHGPPEHARFRVCGLCALHDELQRQMHVGSQRKRPVSYFWGKFSHVCGGGIHAGRARWEGQSESSLSALMPYILKCFSVSMVTQEKTTIRLTLASVIVYWTVCMFACPLPPSSSYPGSDHFGNRKNSVLLRGSGIPRPEGIISSLEKSGSTLGPPLNWMSLEVLQREAPTLVI